MKTINKWPIFQPQVKKILDTERELFKILTTNTLHSPVDVCRFVSVSMGLSACNSSGHLSNHADIAPHHAGITFAVSNTLVSNSATRAKQTSLSAVNCETLLIDVFVLINIT